MRVILSTAKGDSMRQGSTQNVSDRYRVSDRPVRWGSCIKVVERMDFFT